MGGWVGPRAGLDAFEKRKMGNVAEEIKENLSENCCCKLLIISLNSICKTDILKMAHRYCMLRFNKPYTFNLGQQLAGLFQIESIA
jgi:hypothetical protein